MFMMNPTCLGVDSGSPQNSSPFHWGNLSSLAWFMVHSTIPAVTSSKTCRAESSAIAFGTMALRFSGAQILCIDLYYIYFNNTKYTIHTNGNNYERGSFAKLPIYFDQYMTWW